MSAHETALDTIRAASLAQTEELGQRRMQIVMLRAALKRVIDAHCANDRIFCGTCSPARALLSTIGADLRTVQDVLTR
jgi:hypothetical protein